MQRWGEDNQNNPPSPRRPPGLAGMNLPAGSRRATEPQVPRPLSDPELPFGLRLVGTPRRWSGVVTVP